jgi:uncharacterized delta-60 repeat protein
MQNPSKLTRTLLVLAIVLVSTLISGRPLRVVRAAESSGTLDASFGTGGKVTTDFAGLDDSAISVAVEPNGKIVVAGDTFTGTDSDFALARYNRDGTLDTSFGTGGKLTTDFAGSDDFAASVAVEPNGKIVVAGVIFTGAGPDFALARYNRDGTLDASGPFEKFFYMVVVIAARYVELRRNQ